MARLILFDIDLTLIKTNGAGRDAMDAAFRELFGVHEPTKGIAFEGRTDRAIFLEALTRQELTGPALEAAYGRALDGYVERLPGTLVDRGGEILPGVPALLDGLGGRAAIGLATGNIERGARLKLGHFGLWERFAAGGFGDGRSERADVVRAAIAALAAAASLPADPLDCIVIGDTPNDVAAAHAAGARALAVATGAHSLEQLRAVGPAWAVADLGDTAAILEILGR
ncbi:MAG: HAD family hydrolase [Dehalococcoidia bacterium]